MQLTESKRLLIDMLIKMKICFSSPDFFNTHLNMIPDAEGITMISNEEPIDVVKLSKLNTSEIITKLCEHETINLHMENDKYLIKGCIIIFLIKFFYMINDGVNVQIDEMINKKTFDHDHVTRNTFILYIIIDTYLCLERTEKRYTHNKYFNFLNDNIFQKINGKPIELSDDECYLYNLFCSQILNKKKFISMLKLLNPITPEIQLVHSLYKSPIIKTIIKSNQLFRIFKNKPVGGDIIYFFYFMDSCKEIYERLSFQVWRTIRIKLSKPNSLFKIECDTVEPIETSKKIQTYDKIVSHANDSVKYVNSLVSDVSQIVMMFALDVCESPEVFVDDFCNIIIKKRIEQSNKIKKCFNSVFSCYNYIEGKEYNVINILNYILVSGNGFIEDYDCILVPKIKYFYKTFNHINSVISNKKTLLSLVQSFGTEDEALTYIFTLSDVDKKDKMISVVREIMIKKNKLSSIKCGDYELKLSGQCVNISGEHYDVYEPKFSTFSSSDKYFVNLMKYIDMSDEFMKIDAGMKRLMTTDFVIMLTDNIFKHIHAIAFYDYNDTFTKAFTMINDILLLFDDIEVIKKINLWLIETKKIKIEFCVENCELNDFLEETSKNL